MLFHPHKGFIRSLSLFTCTLHMYVLLLQLTGILKCRIVHLDGLLHTLVLVYVVEQMAFSWTFPPSIAFNVFILWNLGKDPCMYACCIGIHVHVHTYSQYICIACNILSVVRKYCLVVAVKW